MTSIFSKIISGEIPTDKLFENDKVIAIKDKYPKAPVHILIIPKKAITDLQSMQPEDFPLLGEVVKVAQELATKFNIADGYRLSTNNGAKAGQSVFHLHFHLMGGRQFSGEGE
jgi:diadenosine tetraphosphate (Ap4A) HIT family hydrolase